MEKLTNSLQDTSIYLSKQEETIDSSIKTLVEHEDRLRAYMILYMLAKKSNYALNIMKSEVPDIEKRLGEEIDEISKQARGVLDGAETRAKWIKDIIDALGKLCGSTDLPGRENALHNQMEEMENALEVLIAKRNKLSLDQLDKEK